MIIGSTIQVKPILGHRICHLLGKEEVVQEKYNLLLFKHAILCDGNLNKTNMEHTHNDMKWLIHASQNLTNGFLKICIFVLYRITFLYRISRIIFTLFLNITCTTQYKMWTYMGAHCSYKVVLLLVPHEGKIWDMYQHRCSTVISVISDKLQKNNIFQGVFLTKELKKWASYLIKIKLEYSIKGCDWKAIFSSPYKREIHLLVNIQ